MNYFEVTRGDNVDIDSICLLAHPDKTKEDFEKDCDRLVKLAAKTIMEQSEGTITGDMVVDELIELLVRTGYELPDPTVSLWYSACSFETRRGSGSWKKVLGVDLRNEIVDRTQANIKTRYYRDLWFIAGESNCYHRWDCAEANRAVEAGARVRSLPKEFLERPFLCEKYKACHCIGEGENG